MTSNSTASDEAGNEKIVWQGGALKFFVRYDGPYIKETISLGNHPLRKILLRQFEYMSRNLHFISAFGRYLLGFGQEENVIKAEEIASNTINNAIKAIRTRIEQAEVLLNKAGITDQALYGKKEAIVVPITTPGARLYAQMLSLTDQFYSLNYLLWINGEIDNRAHFQNQSEARKIVQNAVRGVASQFMFILNKTREKDADVAAAAGSHNEQQLADQAVIDINEEMGNRGMTGTMSDGAGDKAASENNPPKRTASSAKSTAELPAIPAAEQVTA